jgi:hypothetical protein
MYVVAKCFKAPRTWTDSLARPKKLKKDMGFGTWNVRSLRRVGSIEDLGLGERITLRWTLGRRDQWGEMDSASLG